jgi:hypothetical protein
MANLIWTWVLFGVSNLLLVASIPMLWTGKLPNGRKVHPVVATAIFVVGMTGLLVFGPPDLLKNTLTLLM